MPLWGNLKEFNLQEVLRFISESKKSGRLVLKSGGEEAAIYFSQGRISQIDSPIARARETIKSDELEGFLLEEAARDLAELFSWKDAEFTFEGQTKQMEALLDLELEDALREAETKLARLEELKQTFPPETSPLRLVKLSFSGKKLTLDSEEWRLICCLGTKDTLENIKHRFGRDSLTFYEILAKMLKNRLIEAEPSSSAVSRVEKSPAPIQPSEESAEEKGAEEQAESPTPVQGKYIRFNED
ncbi:MAG: DUF4388 domain-containing protein [Actinomycetota bacterium]